MRVANAKSTSRDEMVNMPAGMRLRNCCERFGQFYKTTGSPKTNTASLRNDQTTTNNASDDVPQPASNVQDLPVFAKQ